VTETAWIIRDAEGGILGFEGMISDITPRKMAEERVARMARFDELTGLPNRARLNESLGSALASDARGTIVLCLDLDRFKIVNDTLGHPAGDALLRAMAQRFAALATAGDTVARLGGDEFAFVLTGSTKAAAAALAARIVAATDTPVIIEERPIQVGVSVGIAQGSHDCDDPVQLMKRADLALYRAKAAGRSTHRFFSPEMDAALAERQGLELDLRQALESSQFKVFYQPIVDLADGRVAGVEALLRWTHPTRGSIPPDTFIAIAEETRLIVPIGEWVLNRACRDARHLPQGVSVSVNVSTIQLAQCDFEAVLARALAASGLPAERLVIEITETTLMDARVNVAPMLARLRARGIRLALDDFGTGYSSLGYLRSFDFDILKLAHAFIGNLVEQETAAIVETVLQLGERLGIATTAEGIETPEQLAALRSGRCRYGQGRLFGDPRDLSSLLADGLCSAAAAWRAHDLQLDPAKETR
jgi:diguanylate cyclase (GGDEF)-like protein